MRVLVTGAAGHLGRLAGARLAREHEVLGIDVRAAPDAGFAVERLDVRDPALAALVRDRAIEAVVHLAAVLETSRDRARDFDIDVNGTANVLAAAVAGGVRHLTVSSSGAAYGYHADNPAWLREDHPLRGNAEVPYADHKRRVEALLAQARATHPALRQLVFRIGTVLGERVDSPMTALFHRPRLLAVRGSASPFVFVWDEDVADAIAHGLQGEREGTYNLVGNGALEVSAIAAALGKPVLALPAWLLAGALAVGRPLAITRYGPEQVRVLRYRPVLSNARLRAEFGWAPRYDAAACLERFARAQGLWKGP